VLVDKIVQIAEVIILPTVQASATRIARTR
jgi:hypothetical protein